MKPNGTLVASIAGCAALAAAFFSGRLWATGIPTSGTLTYTGSLENPDGSPVTAASKNIALFTYDAATTGSVIQDCSVMSGPVTLTQGRFQIPLPEKCPSVVHANPDLWIEVQVDGLPLGRTKLGAVPYAVEAGHAVAADTASNAVGSLATQTVPPGAVVAFNLSNCPTGWTPLASAAGRVVVGVNAATGGGLSTRNLGDTVGEEAHTMTTAEMPSHSHDLLVRHAGSGENHGFWNFDWASTSIFGSQVAIPPTFGAGFQNFLTIEPSGSGAAFNNMQPSIALLYCQKT